MRKFGLFTIAGFLALTIFMAQGCNFSTANLSSLKTSKDADGKTEASSFTTGETLYANAVVANNPGKVKVKFQLLAEDVKGINKGEMLKGSDVTVDIPGDGVAKYSVPVSPALPAGSYKLNADMMNEDGEKKDSKTANVTITQTAPAAPTGPSSDANSTSDTDSDTDN